MILKSLTGVRFSCMATCKALICPTTRDVNNGVFSNRILVVENQFVTGFLLTCTGLPRNLNFKPS